MTPATSDVLGAALPLLASLPRAAALFIVVPLFGRRVLRGILRNEFVLVLALFVYPLAVSIPTGPASAPIVLAFVALKEALIGLVLGFFLGVVFWVAENLGYLVDLQTGTNNASVFDPLRESDDGPAASFMLQFVTALVLAGGGLLALLEILFESYRVWPIWSSGPVWGEALRGAASARADSLLALTLRFAAPVIVVLLLIELGLGLANRFADHLDVYSLSMPIKSLVAYLVLLLFASFIYESIRGLLLFDAGVLRGLGGTVHGR